MTRDVFYSKKNTKPFAGLVFQEIHGFNLKLNLLVL